VPALVRPTHARTPTDPRQLCTSLCDLAAVRGGGAGLDQGRGGRPPHQVWHAARAFFDNGGRQLHVGSIAAGALPAAADYEAALRRLESVQGVSIVAAPGLAARATQVSDPDTEARYRAVLRHLDATRYRFAILDPPDGQTPAEVRSLRARLRSSNAALYYPWVTASDPRTGSTMVLPPGGFLAGVYARVDRERGVHQAPANEEVRLATGLERALTHGEMEGLNQEGVSCLRLLLGRGLDEDSEIVLWVRAVATALVAGVVAKIVLFPPGGLATVPLEVRLGAVGCGLVGYFLLKRSPFAGLVVGEAALVAGVLAVGR
jgi:hypothetical protein